VRSRIDWKYLLGLPLDDDGFDASVLVDYRDRLLAGKAETRLLELLLEQAKTHGLLKSKGQQRTDATHVLAAVRELNRLELVFETVKAALNALAVAAPAWLAEHGDAAWVKRYGRGWAGGRPPTSDAARQSLAEQIGRDGLRLLRAVEEATAVPRWDWLGKIPALTILRRIWAQQYDQHDRELRWRATSALPPAQELVCSPYDAEVRYGKKEEVGWTGTKIHLTETCDPTQPRLIVQVTPTHSCTHDATSTAAIQQDLARRELAPERHIVDAGYTDAELLVTSQERGIDLVGPIQPDSSWQAQAGEGYDLRAFHLDWEAKQATCPQGKQSGGWREERRPEATVIRIHFRQSDCQACPVQAHCTRAPRRSLTVRPRTQHEARQAAAAREQTEAFRQTYALRAGIEGTISQGVRRLRLRRSRYRGFRKSALRDQLLGAGLNLRRLGDWLLGRHPATARQPAFVRVLAASSP